MPKLIEPDQLSRGLGATEGTRDATRSVMALVTAVLALAVALVPSAMADRTFVRDPKGDSKCGPADDIRKAMAGHASRGRLKHVVWVQKAKPNFVPDIFIKVGKSKQPRYRVWGGFGVRAVMDNKTGEETGIVKVKRRRNRWTLLFHPSALGNPAAYSWAANTSAGSANHFTCDQAPRKRYKVHRLR